MKASRRATAALVATILIGGLMVASAGSAAAGDPCPDSLFTESERRTNGFEEICGDPIVFSDAKTGDLWLTDEFGGGPYRLTNTPMIEENPAGLFPWVFYDGTTKDGSDVYQLSLIDPGHARSRITGLKTEDWDPTAVMLYDLNQSVEASEVGDRAMAKGPGGLFFPILLAYSSDRDASNDKCGIEIFVELLTIFGPERATDCNRSDKMDAEFSQDGYALAYEAWRFNGSPAEIRVDSSMGGSSTLTNGMFPTWSPYCCPGGGGAPEREPSQPAGDAALTYTNGAGELYDIWADGTDNSFFVDTGRDNQMFGESEWNAFGDRVVANIYTPRKSWLVIITKGGGPPITSKKKFWVQSMDFVSPAFLT